MVDIDEDSKVRMVYHIQLVVLVIVWFESLSDDDDKRCSTCYSYTDEQVDTLRWNWTWYCGSQSIDTTYRTYYQ